MQVENAIYWHTDVQKPEYIIDQNYFYQLYIYFMLRKLFLLRLTLSSLIALGLLSIFGDENVQPTNSPLPAKLDNFRNVLLLNFELNIKPPSLIGPQCGSLCELGRKYHIDIGLASLDQYPDQ